MPMTLKQASIQNLVNSVRDWIATNVATPYTTDAAGKPYAGAPVIALADPDDTAVYQDGSAHIAIEMPTDGKAPESLGIGEGIVWKHKDFFVSVYPSINQDGIDAGKPSIQSAQLLQTYFDYAFSTALVIPINDYSTGSKGVILDYAYVENQRIIRPRGAGINALAMMKHRFDYTFTLKYTAVTIN